MAELPSMIQDLALMLVVAGIVTLIFKKLKQPLVLGYIVPWNQIRGTRASLPTPWIHWNGR